MNAVGVCFTPVLLLLTTVLMSAVGVASDRGDSKSNCPNYLNHSYRLLHSTTELNLCDAFDGNVLLVVNTASHCGFSTQFRGLEALYQRYRNRGLSVVGFASNDFNQESADEKLSADICFINYGVTFAMLAPTSVKGNGANPTFLALAEKSQEPVWNFNKYLVSADGQRVTHFGSFVKPDDELLLNAIDTELLEVTAP